MSRTEITVEVDENDSESREYGPITVSMGGEDACFFLSQTGGDSSDYIHVTPTQIDALIEALKDFQTRFEKPEVGGIWGHKSDPNERVTIIGRGLGLGTKFLHDYSDYVMVVGLNNGATRRDDIFSPTHPEYNVFKEEDFLKTFMRIR